MMQNKDKKINAMREQYKKAEENRCRKENDKISTICRKEIMASQD